MAFTFRTALLRHVGIASILAVALAEQSAFAEDAALVEVAEQEFGLAGTFEGPAPLAEEEVGAGIYLAQPVGSVTVGEEAAGPGKRRYAARSTVAGSASIISFSSTPVSDGSVGMAMIGPGQMPLARSRLTSAFGVRRSSADGGIRWHAGVDLAAPTGSPVAAAYGGRVTMADWNGGYGLLVVVDHGNGMQTRYAHLSRLNVAPGQQVRQGDLVGFVGSTGNSTGPHLHYELRRNGQPVNPLH